MTNESSSLDEFLGARQTRKLPRWVKWVAIALALLVVIVAMRFYFSGTKEVAYATTPARRGDMQVNVTATGNLKPINEVTVGSEVSGLIRKVFVDENDHVVQGQPLAEIDLQRPTDAVRRSQASVDSARANVLQAEAQAELARANLGRQEEVFRVSGGKVPSQAELDSTRASYRSAQANLAVARASVTSARAQLSQDQINLDRATIRSPVTGVILSREVDPGQTVAASFNTPTLFLIAQDLAEMELEVKVDEADVGQVREGLPATFTVDAYPGKTFPATIKRVNVGSNGASSTTTASSSGVVSYGALLTVKNTDLSLRPGMTATATIVTAQEKNVLLVPNAALRFQPRAAGASPGAGGPPAGGSMLPIPQPGRFRRASSQEVEIGRGSRRTVYTVGPDNKLTPHEVIAGSTDGTQTIVTSKTLKDGMKVVTGELAKAKP